LVVTLKNWTVLITPWLPDKYRTSYCDSGGTTTYFGLTIMPYYFSADKAHWLQENG